MIIKYYAEIDAENFIIQTHEIASEDGLLLPDEDVMAGNTIVELESRFTFSEPTPTSRAKLVNGVPTWVELGTLEQIRTRKLKEINAACEATLAAVKAGYPDSEVLSWSVQETEARAYVLDPLKPIPFLTALATARDITVPDLVALIIAKADAFAGISGSLIGKRQKLEKLAELAETIEDIEVIVW